MSEQRGLVREMAALLAADAIPVEMSRADRVGLLAVAASVPPGVFPGRWPVERRAVWLAGCWLARDRGGPLHTYPPALRRLVRWCRTGR